jgi:hypothetical protein
MADEKQNENQNLNPKPDAAAIAAETRAELAAKEKAAPAAAPAADAAAAPADDDVDIVDIIQAHDMLVSILLGRVIAMTAEPAELGKWIVDTTATQDITPAAKAHIKMLVEPIIEAIAEEEKKA